MAKQTGREEDEPLSVWGGGWERNVEVGNDWTDNVNQETHLKTISIKQGIKVKTTSPLSWKDSHKQLKEWKMSNKLTPPKEQHKRHKCIWTHDGIEYLIEVAQEKSVFLEHFSIHLLFCRRSLCPESRAVGAGAQRVGGEQQEE